MSSAGYRCDDGRLHNTQAGANACRFHPEDKHFDNYPKLPKRPYVRKRVAPSANEDEGGDDIHGGTPASPALSATSWVTVSTAAHTLGSSPATPAPQPPRQSYHTPYSQGTQKQTQASPPPAPTGPRFTDRSPSTGVQSPPLPSIETGSDVGSPAGKPNTPPPIPTCQAPQLRNMDEHIRASSLPASLPSASNRATGSPATTILVPETPAPGQQGRPIDFNSEPTGSEPTDSEAADPADVLAQDIEQLRADRVRLTENLKDSTALVARLRQRWELARIDTQIQKGEAQRAKANAQAAQANVNAARAETEAVKDAKRTAWGVAVLVIVAQAAYGAWTWYNRADFAYIRKRQFEMFGMASQEY